MKLNLNMNVKSIFNFVIQFQILIPIRPRCPYPIWTISQANIDSCTHRFETEPPILENHISLMGKERESQFFDLDSTLEPKPTLKTKLDLSHIPKLVLVPIPFIPEPKLFNTKNHILLLDQGIEHNDFEMIFQD